MKKLVSLPVYMYIVHVHVSDRYKIHTKVYETSMYFQTRVQLNGIGLQVNSDVRANNMTIDFN